MNRLARPEVHPPTSVPGIVGDAGRRVKHAAGAADANRPLPGGGADCLGRLRPGSLPSANPGGCHLLAFLLGSPLPIFESALASPPPDLVPFPNAVPGATLLPPVRPVALLPAVRPVPAVVVVPVTVAAGLPFALVPPGRFGRPVFGVCLVGTITVVALKLGNALGELVTAGLASCKGAAIAAPGTSAEASRTSCTGMSKIGPVNDGAIKPVRRISSPVFDVNVPRSPNIAPMGTNAPPPAAIVMPRLLSAVPRLLKGVLMALVSVAMPLFVAVSTAMMALISAVWMVLSSERMGLVDWVSSTGKRSEGIWTSGSGAATGLTAMTLAPTRATPAVAYGRIAVCM